MKVTGIGGGIGASRLWRVLAPVVDDLTLVVNTGEDLWHYGLRVCPDIDTTLYALSDRQDLERGWGLRGETFRVMDEVRGLGDPVWFNLGDRDLATHLLRTGWLREGVGLAEATARLAVSMGVAARVLPMTEQEVTTTVVTEDRRHLHYEEFLVREACAPRITEVAYAGAGIATPAPGVLSAIADADVVVVAPSNPVASIDPILAIPGVREALARRRADVIAVSPIVAGVPITNAGEQRRADSRAALLRLQGDEPVPSAVAARYADICSRFALDPSDDIHRAAVASAGIEPIVAPLLFHLGASPTGLVTALLRTTTPA